jgi:hypothetical protein
VLERAQLAEFSHTLFRELLIVSYVQTAQAYGIQTVVSVIVMPGTLALAIRSAYRVVWVHGRAISEECLALHVKFIRTRSRSQLHHRPLVLIVQSTPSPLWAVLSVLALPGTPALTVRSVHLVVLAHTSTPLDLRLALSVVLIPTRPMWRLHIVLNVRFIRHLQPGASHPMHACPGVLLVCTTT